MSDFPSLSTDQVAAFIELAQTGSLRRAAEKLHLTEQGIRNRLLMLEHRLGATLYQKRRGPRRQQPLTEQGRDFLPHALAFLERARQLAEVFHETPQPREIRVAATQYMIVHALIRVIRRFHKAYPHIRIRLVSRTEQEIEQALLSDPDLAFGVAAPYEGCAELRYHHLFSLEWSLIAPPKHSLLHRPRVGLADLTDLPLILFERGSTGRQHVMEAFHGAGLSPLIEMETTNTEIALRMVEAGLGVSIVPLMPDGSVQRGRRVGTRRLGDLIRPIASGILVRRDDPLSPTSRMFMEYLQVAHRTPTRGASEGAD
jgi:DNA-binding transcriptional LysR family regulator